jgi:hypothetical protein
MTRIRRFATFFIVLAVFFPYARAQQLSLTDLRSRLVGEWTVTFQTGAKARTLIIKTVEQKAGGSFSITGSYNTTGEKEAPLSEGEAAQTPDGIQVKFTATSGAAVAATLKPDGSFAGSSNFKGESFPLTIAKGAAVAAATLSAGADQDLKGTYKGEYKFELQRHGTETEEVTLAITSVENGNVTGTFKAVGQDCSGDYTISGKAAKGKLTLKRGAGPMAGCGNDNLILSLVAGKLIGSVGKYHIELSK